MISNCPRNQIRQRRFFLRATLLIRLHTDWKKHHQKPCDISSLGPYFQNRKCHKTRGPWLTARSLPDCTTAPDWSHSWWVCQFKSCNLAWLCHSDTCALPLSLLSCLRLLFWSLCNWAPSSQRLLPSQDAQWLWGRRVAQISSEAVILRRGQSRQPVLPY